MRITIGGVLLFVGAGAVGTVAFLPSGTAPENVERYVTTIREKVNVSLGLFRSASVESPNISLPVESPSPAATIPIAEAPVAIPPVAVVPTPVPEVDAKPVVKKTSASRRRPRRKTIKKKSVATKKSAVQATAPATTSKPVAKTGGSLIGSDVILTLTTGREVRGVLQEQDAIAYKVELPGLGIFTYPLQNVKSIRGAE